ncbi:DNA-directed RNA polymerase specialized sigma24 family protein [Kitasatospora sp. GAS204A]|uniref:RNA polymerase sigma factor n=1 Tax=unclassified Kitasatospora TaxID=2633591 RepID=UPI002474ACFC|nr:sigma factor [Kitasatospora sp. GAS204B]MDH6121997.1 DNA-directed RNA polymerase specialized sigma24 family protein [Kitasatospora sp. GAS204B]
MTTTTDFEALYRSYARQITSHITARLFRPDAQLAEDLTSETFLTLWRKMGAGLAVERPRALLMLMADRAVADHFRRASSRESATDFAATNLSEVPAGAAAAPHLAGLLAELEAAKDALTLAADTYRAVNKGFAVASACAAQAKQPEAVTRWQARRAEAGEARARALDGFAEAARAVAVARAAWNAAAVDHSALVLVGRGELAGVA